MKDSNGLGMPKSLEALLTVVILTHNRPAFLLRALTHYSGLPCRLLVLDSSAEPLHSAESTLPSVDYRHVPEYGYWSFQTKVAYGVSLVETPYTVLASDDDFMLLDALKASVDFLQSHQDYSFCHGYCLMFRAEADFVKYLRRDKKVREDYDDELAQDRILSYMGQYIPPFYAVTRTSLLREFFEVMDERGFEWMEIGHVFFLLGRGKARILPIPYVVRETSIVVSDHGTDVAYKLAYQDPRIAAERDAFAEFLAGLPLPWGEMAPAQRKLFALEAFQTMYDGLCNGLSLTMEPIFQSIWNVPEDRPTRVFGPNQYVEMPFYNQAFFDQLTEYEFLQHALPAGRMQLAGLEGVWVRQHELLKLHDNDVPETVLNRLWEAVELSPFNREVIDTLALRLNQQLEAGVESVQEDAQRIASWAARLAAAPQYDYRTVFKTMGSGQVLEWLERRNPDAAQGAALEQRLARMGAAPMFGLFLVDLDDDPKRLQITLDSLVEGYCKNFRIVIFTTSEPPVATIVNNTLHFVKITRHNYVDKLNQMTRETSCDWVMLAQVGDAFTAGGLIRASLELQAEPECRAVAVDEIQRRSDHSLMGVLRPGFNLDLLKSVPSLMARHWLIRRDVLLEVGGYSADYSDALEFELLLRIIEQAGLSGLAHLDEPMLICQERPLGDNEHERLALTRHLSNLGYRPLVTSSRPGTYQIDYRHTDRPLVSIIVHGSDDPAELQRCLTSVLQRTRYGAYEVLVAIAPMLELELNTWLAAQGKDAAKVQVVSNRDGLNPAAFINTIAAQTNGEYMVLLAGDSQIVSPNWLGSLLNQALRPEVGAVGAKLIDEHGRVTQGGLLLGFDGGVGSPFVGQRADEEGYLLRAVVEQNYSAVSGTCMMVRKEVFDAVGGLDEGTFAAAFADVDLSLKITQAGLLLVWTPQVPIIHHGVLPDAPQAMAALREKWADAFAQDPAYNSNLAHTGTAYTLNQAGGSHWQAFLD